MTANPHSIDLPGFVFEHLRSDQRDVLQAMVAAFAQALMSAEADAVCGALGQRSPERPNARNGYRRRDWDTRAARSMSRSRSCGRAPTSPTGCSNHRRRAERALITVVATCYLLGVSTRRMDKLVESLGHHPAVEVAGVGDGPRSGRSRSLRSATRPLAAGPFTFVAADALTMKVREGGRVVNAHGLVATGVNADGHREVLGIKVATAETGQAGRRSSATSSPVACPGCCWSPPTPTVAWSPRSRRPCPARRGSAAAPTTRRT